MLFALLLYLACVLTEVTMDPHTREIHQSVNTTLLLKGIDLNASSIFNVEWRAQLNGSEKNKISILTFSPRSKNFYINESYKKRAVFGHTNFSLMIQRVTSSDEGIYTLAIQMLNTQQRIDSTRVRVIIPVSNVSITSDSSAPHLGKNITLNCLVTAGNAMSYSWQKCNQPLPNGNRTILSNDNTSLTLVNIQQSDIGNYRCVVQNVLSSAYEDFILQLCAETDVSSWLSYGIYGYPGYLGYAIVIFCILSWTRKRCSKEQPEENFDNRRTEYINTSTKMEGEETPSPDAIYENLDFENTPAKKDKKVPPIDTSQLKK